MAMKTDQIKLPVSVATEIVNKAKDTSTIASLSPSTPQIFSDADYLVFNGKSEAEVVAEGAVKNVVRFCFAKKDSTLDAGLERLAKAIKRAA